MIRQIIKSLTKDEVRSLKLFLNRTNESAERKDIYLFDQLRKHSKGEEEICKQLYGNNKNNYYRLKNRLKEDIGRSLLSQHSKATPDQEAINDYLLANQFFRKQEHEIASHYLKKAEKRATKIHNLELLDIIYSEQIKLARETLNVNPERIIETKKNNRKELNKLSELDDLLAVLMYRIKTSQNYVAQSDSVLSLLSDTIHAYSSEETLRKNPVIRFKIYHGVSRILLQNQDFVSLESYLKETFNTFEKDKLFTKRNHETKLQMLTYLCNALFKNDKHENSLVCAEQLLVAMREYNYSLYDKFVFYYYNILYYNYSVLDRNKALKILNEASKDDVIRRNPINNTFILLQLAVFYFDESDYKKASGQIKELQDNEKFESLDNALKIKVMILDAMTATELNTAEMLEESMKTIKADQSKQNWKKIGCEREELMAKIIPLLVINRSSKEDKALEKQLKELEASDIRSDLVNYGEWLKKWEVSKN